MSTFMAKAETIERKWYVIDAAGKPVGKTAVAAANILRGKHRPEFTPHADCGEFVIIINAGKAVFTGKKLGFAPCTPQACMEILDYYGIDCKGKNAVVIGRSLVIGKPVSLLLLAEHATVTICHSRSENLPEICREADILVVAAGKAGMVGAESVRAGQVVLDVGIHVGADGNLCGDTRFAEVEPVVEAITPVPGGVGAVTTAIPGIILQLILIPILVVVMERTNMALDV